MKAIAHEWFRLRVKVHFALWRVSPVAAEVWTHLSLLGLHLPMERK